MQIHNVFLYITSIKESFKEIQVASLVYDPKFIRFVSKANAA